MLCANQIDLEMEHRGQGLHPEPCILLGSINFSQPDMQGMVDASGNTTSLHVQHPPEYHDSIMFYGMPQYHAVQRHPHCTPNLDLAIASASNFYVPYMNPSGISLSHRSCGQIPSSSNYGVLRASPDGYRLNSQFMDNARGMSKRKNAEGNLENFFNASASSSSSVAPVNMRQPDGVGLTDSAAFGLPHPHYGSPTLGEVGSHRSMRNRSGATALDPVTAHNQNQFIQGSFIGQPFQPVSSLWLEQQLSNGSTDAGATVWTQTPHIPYMHGSNVLGGLVENGNMGPQQYLEQTTSTRGTSFLHPSPRNLLQNFHHLSSPVQEMRVHNISVLPQVPAASFHVPTNYPSHSALNLSQDGLDVGRHLGSVQPTGLGICRPHREDFAPEANVRHHSLPHLRVLPTDGVAVLEFPDYYEVENYVDHHRDMRLDIEGMTYEELLALGERIGNVNAGLSEEIVKKTLKTRIYTSSHTSINLEEAAIMDQELNSCIICQDDYKSGDKIGTLDCGHEYHANCLTKWLRLKNVCPICKSEALSAERHGTLN